MALVTTLFTVEITFAGDLNSTKKLLDKNITIRNNTILAIVNGKNILKSSFDKSYEKLTLKQKKETLKEVISTELLVQYAEKQPLYKDKKLIEKVKNYRKDLKEKGKKFTDLDFRMVLGLHVIRSLVHTYAEKEATDDNIHHYYVQRRNNFKGMPYVDAFFIKTSSKKIAEEIIEEINSDTKKDKKEIFLKLMKKNHMENIGNLGRVYKYGIEKSLFNQSLFLLKRNEYSLKPLKIDDNDYRIIFIENKSTLKKVPSEIDLKSNMSFMLKYLAKQEWIDYKIKELKKNAKIMNFLEKK